MNTSIRESVVPTQVANRRLIAQMELWGWQQHRKRGESVEMRHPHIPEKILVRDAQIHKGNSVNTIRRVYELTCGGVAELFWTRKAPVNVDLIDATREAIPTPGSFSAPSDPIQLCEKCEQHHRDSEPCPEPFPTGAAASNRGLAARTLAMMSVNPHRNYTSRDIARFLGLEDVSACASALRHLCECGHAERVMRGTYRLSAKLAAERTVHHAHTGPVEVAVAPAALALNVAPTHRSEPEPEPKVWRHSEEPIRRSTNEQFALVDASADSDDDLDSLLELILPADYRFKPRHLAAMRRWQDETARLLAALRK